MFTQSEVQEALIWFVQNFIYATNIFLILFSLKISYVAYKWKRDCLREEQENRNLCYQKLFDYLENSKPFFELVKNGHPNIFLLNTFHSAPNLSEQYNHYEILCDDYIQLFFIAKTFLILVNDDDDEYIEDLIIRLEFQSKLISQQVLLFESTYGS